MGKQRHRAGLEGTKERGGEKSLEVGRWRGRACGHQGLVRASARFPYLHHSVNAEQCVPFHRWEAEAWRDGVPSLTSHGLE